MATHRFSSTFRQKLLLCFNYLFVFFMVVDSINLDARFSVIRKGTPGTYFGYSVAEHQILQNDVESLFFIGAPKEKRTLGFGTMVGGSLYRCDIELSDIEKTCDLISSADPPRASSSEDLGDQWLGVTVASQGPGKKAVACAHRYIKNNAALGMCVVFDQELLYPEFEYQPCSKLSHTNYLKDFGLCQAGMSASIGQDDAFVMGAPGSVFWQGVIFKTNVTDQVGVSQSEINSPYLDPNQDTRGQQPSPTRPYSYNGYAVAIGKFDATSTLFYASGAPKSHNYGEVVIFKEQPKGNLRWDPPNIIRGPKNFAGFGSALLAVDLNNDGIDELIVGAPYFFEKNRGGAFYVYKGSSSLMTDDTKPTRVLSREMGDAECDQLMCEHARFGISLSKLGDINMDGFQDFAVGAPYEGSGVVYIYHGSDAEAGFDVEYTQRITTADLPTPEYFPASFGHSLSGGMDLDGNGYPDLLVGAYESDAVALIRSRPIINLEADLEVSPQLVDLQSPPKCNVPSLGIRNLDRHCVTVTMCLSFTTEPPSSIRINPRVEYSLEVDSQRQIGRAELFTASGDTEKILTGQKVTLSPGQDTCVTSVALLKSQFDDKLNPIEFRFNFGLESDTQEPQDYPNSASEDINRFPVLNTKDSPPDMANALTAKAGFVMECGDDNLCHSNLQFTAKFENLTRNSDGVHELLTGSKNVLHVVMRLRNDGEPAYLTKIYVQKPENVTYLGRDPLDDVVTCRQFQNETTLIECDQIGNPLREGKNIYFVVRLGVPSDMVESGEVSNITVWVNTSSTETTKASDTHIMFFTVINNASLYLQTNVDPDSAIVCKGEPRGASAIKTEEDIGAAVTHNYIVKFRGHGVVSESYIQIDFPFEVEGEKGGSGKYLLYLMRLPLITGPVEACNNDEIMEFVNPLKIQEIARTSAVVENAPETITYSENNRRRRRSTARTKRATGSNVVMSCRSKGTRCFSYKCKLGKLASTQDYIQISFEARLWESTLLSDYRKAPGVQIMSWGKLTIPERLGIKQVPKDSEKRALTFAIPDLQESSGGEVQWWIILVAVLAGLIVLLVVIFILYKVGFFRRKRMEDMKMYKAEKKQQAMLQDYDNENL